MIEQSDSYDFASMRLSDAEIERIIEAQRRERRLPDLRGVRVWVAGAAAAASGGLSPDRIHRIQDFWLRYFEAAGADLARERYAGMLLDFSTGR